MSDNITLSEDRLRAILAEFKLDLIERLTRELSRKADQHHVDALAKRMDALEEHGSRDAQAALKVSAENEEAIRSLVGWRNRISGVVAVIVIIIIPVTAIVVARLIEAL